MESFLKIPAKDDRGEGMTSSPESWHETNDRKGEYAE